MRKDSLSIIAVILWVGRKMLFAALPILIFGFYQEAGGFNLRKEPFFNNYLHWGSGPIRYVYDSGVPSEAIAAIDAAFLTWQQVTSATVSFALDTGAPKVTISWETLGSGILAYTSTNSFQGQIINATIKFNDQKDWLPTPGGFDIQNAATHEIGNLIGIGDVFDDTEATMYWEGGAGETKKRTLEADDIDAVSFIYPLAAARVNLEIVSGDGQTAAPGEQLADPLVVRVTDGSSTPLAGQLVIFDINSGSGTLDYSFPLYTGADGLAQTTVTLPGSEETIEVRAAATGLEEVIFTAQSSHSGAQEYNIINLGTLDDYGIKAFGINDHSQLVGGLMNADGEYVAGFVWDRSNGLQPLTTFGGKTRAWNINNQGQIVGESNERAVLWEQSTANPLDLGDLGGATSFANRIIDSGQIVGWADTSPDDGLAHAFLFEGGALNDLGTLNTENPEYNYGYSLAYDINSAGHVVGVAHTNGWLLHAFVWDLDNGMTDLGTHPDYPDSEGYAMVINDQGTIAGHGYVFDDDGSYPMLWDPVGESWLSVATPPDFPYAEFYGLNESNQLVGVMWNSDNVQHAFVYDEQNGMRDLNDLIPLNSGWVVTYASGINEKGRIAGFGIYNGEERAFLLLPVLSGDFNKDNDVDGADLARFISEFGSLNCSEQSPCKADLNEDHQVNEEDLKLFADNFGESF